MVDDGKSFQLRYVGTRFDGARLPVDVLQDLPAFRDLLVAFAKDEWRNLNAERKRVPKGFDRSISFDLVSIEEGSAVPKLNWSRDDAQSSLPGFADQLQEVVGRSFDDVVALVDGAGHGKFPQSLSSEHVRALNRLGSSLRDGERIEFLGAKGADGNVVYLDTYRRKELITRVRETYHTRFESVGTLVGQQAAQNSYITVLTKEFGVISINLERDRITNEFDGNIDSDVQFSLKIELDSSDQFKGVAEVLNVELIDADVVEQIAKCRQRLDQISRLKKGWQDGAEAIDALAIEAANRFLSMRPSLAAKYRIFPTEDQGVLLEFESNGWDFSLEFLKAGALEMYGVEISGDHEMEPHHFNEVGEAFAKEFDRRVGR